MHLQLRVVLVLVMAVSVLVSCSPSAVVDESSPAGNESVVAPFPNDTNVGGIFTDDEGVVPPAIPS